MVKSYKLLNFFTIIIFIQIWILVALAEKKAQILIRAVISLMRSSGTIGLSGLRARVFNTPPLPTYNPSINKVKKSSSYVIFEFIIYKQTHGQSNAKNT